jgi:hypothetical protein
MTDPRVTAALKVLGIKNSPETIKKLLRAIAGSGSAKANQHDVILLGAVELIEGMETIISIAASGDEE